MDNKKDYIYYDSTTSLCVKCHRTIAAKVVFEDGKVFLHKTCKEHGFQKVIIADDVEFYKRIRNYNRKSDYPLKPHTGIEHGCPFDCGICPDHEQHSCLSLIEITDRCNLTCPTCYASSSPTHGRHRSLAEVEQMLNTIVESEGQPDVVQISGGEPAIHPDFFAILDMAKARPIKHLMVNTNGVRIANDKEFVNRLASYSPDFEIYLQFDSLDPHVLKQLRGEDLASVRRKALENLNELNLSTTLVVTLQKGLNDHEIGSTIDFALRQRCVRGITFQPVSASGRLENFNPATDRLTNTEVRRMILNQSGIFQPNDLILVPCNPDALIMAYALKVDGEVHPLTRFVDPEILLTDKSKNTIVYERDEALHQHLVRLFSTGNSCDAVREDMTQLLCCLPKVVSKDMGYDSLFRILIMNFMDAYDFDVRAVKKSCVHIVTTDDRIIPFETMNLFYRSKALQACPDIK